MPNMSADDQLNTRKRRHDDSVAQVADLRQCARMTPGGPLLTSQSWDGLMARLSSYAAANTRLFVRAETR